MGTLNGDSKKSKCIQTLRLGCCDLSDLRRVKEDVCFRIFVSDEPLLESQTRFGHLRKEMQE